MIEEQELEDIEARNLEEEEDNDLVSFKRKGGGLKVLKFNCCKRCCIAFL